MTSTSAVWIDSLRATVQHLVNLRDRVLGQSDLGAALQQVEWLKEQAALAEPSGEDADALRRLRDDVSDLYRQIASARDLAKELEPGRRDPARVADIDRAMERRWARILRTAVALDRALQPEVTGSGVAASSRPGPMTQSVKPVAAAQRFLRLAALLVPTDFRDRYSEEFRGELFDLAAAGSAWWNQLAYSLRLLDRAWVLRAELHVRSVRGDYS